MKISFENYTNKKTEASIADAIGGTIDEAGYDGGQVERVADRASKQAEMFGQLIQLLHQNGCLRDEQVASMLGYRYTVEEVSQNFIGEWQAWEEGTYDCDCDQDGFFTTCVIGEGSTMMEAIEDLKEQMEG